MIMSFREISFNGFSLFFPFEGWSFNWIFWLYFVIKVFLCGKLAEVSLRSVLINRDALKIIFKFSNYRLTLKHVSVLKRINKNLTSFYLNSSAHIFTWIHFGKVCKSMVMEAWNVGNLFQSCFLLTKSWVLIQHIKSFLSSAKKQWS